MFQGVIAILSVLGIILYIHNPKIKKGKKVSNKESVQRSGLYILLVDNMLALSYFLMYGMNYLAMGCICFAAMAVYGIHKR